MNPQTIRLAATTTVFIVLVTLLSALFVSPPATHAAFPGANGKLAFERNLNGNNSEIIVANPDGTGQTNITNDPSNDVDPAWSPDGSKIVFGSDRNGGVYHLYVMNPNGSGVVQLTNASDLDITPTWSPDGTKIAFTRRVGGSNEEIFIINANGTNPVNLTNNGARDSRPSWSPDGNKIAFESDRNGSPDIFIMNPNGTSVTPVTTTGSNGNASWSPNGLDLAFHHCPGACQIHTIHANGTGDVALTANGYNASPDWSPDGAKIVFDHHDPGDYEIFVMNANGSGQTNVSNNPENESEASWQSAPPDCTNIWHKFDTSNSPLSSNFINVIAVDQQGLKWIGTYGNGVYRFDGTTWTRFDSSNSSIADLTLFSINVAPDDSKWFATNNGGIARFDNTNWSVINKNNSQFPDNGSMSVAFDIDQAVWFTTGGAGAARLKDSTWTIYSPSNSGIPSVNSGQVHIDSQGFKWFTTTNGLARFDNTTWTVYNTSNSGVPVNYLFPLTVAPDGTLWMSGNEQGGAIHFDGSTWTVYNPSNSPLPSVDVRDIAIDRFGTKWFAMGNGNVVQFDGTHWTIFNGSNSTLSGATVYKIAQDHDNLWFATQNGVVVLERQCANEGTPTVTPSRTQTPTQTYTSGATDEPSATPTATSTRTFTPTHAPTLTKTPTRTPTATPSPSGSAPVVISVDPDNGADNEITYITINGANFFGTPDVTIGEQTLSDVSRLSSSQLLASVPAGMDAGTYDVVVCNPDEQCGTLPDGYTVTGSAPTLLSIIPNQGFNNAPNDVTLYGYNLKNGATISIGGTALQDVTWINSTQVQGVVPINISAGSKNISAQNPGSAPGNTLTNGYTALAPGGDDFFATSDDIWTSPTTLRQGDVVQVGVNIHRQGGSSAAQVDVAFYLGDPDNDGTLLDTYTTPPMPTGSGVVESAFIDWDTAALQGNQQIYVVIDPDNQLSETSKANNTASRTITILSDAADETPPQITGLTINGGAESTTDPNVQIAIQAQDQGGSGVHSMYLVEREFNSSAGQWIAIQRTGWIPFSSPYNFTLTSRGGIRYIQAWVADNAGNISSEIYKAEIDYQPDSDTLLAGQVRVYRRTLGVNETLDVTLTTLSGDADLYIWRPDSGQSWVSNASGTATDHVNFDAPQAGTYQIEVFGYETSEYQLTITGGNEESSRRPHSAVNFSKTVRTQPVIAPSNQPEGNSAVPPAPVGGGGTITPTPTRTNTPTPTRTATATETATRTATPTLVCNSAKPKLKSPADNSIVTVTRPKLKWKAASCAVTYNVTIKDAVTGKKVDSKKGVTKLQYKTKLLVSKKKYKWSVQACNARGCAKSKAWQFTVK